MFITRLFTIHERNNTLRHFGTKIGNCWWYNSYEILYLIENGTIKSHPVLDQPFFFKILQNKTFQEEYSFYKYLKEKHFNIIDGKLYVHTKEFNRKHPQQTLVPLSAQLDDEVRLFDHIAIISSFDKKYCLKITKTQLTHQASDKINKGHRA